MTLAGLRTALATRLEPMSGWQAWKTNRLPRPPRAPHHFAGPLLQQPGHACIEIDLRVDLTWPETRAYRYSKLYWSRDPRASFTEAQVMCFRIRENGVRHRLRVEIPPEARGAGFMVLRFDPFFAADGCCEVFGMRLVRADDGDATLTEGARLDALKETTRRAVAESEAGQREHLPHYPESLQLELQPGCNLTCGHCSSHGTDPVHDRHNRMGAITPERLEALAAEVFPHLTLVNLVGRGEPLMISDALWNSFIGGLARHRVLFTAVTNGYFIKRRITREVLPHLDTLTVSIDGFDPATFAANRGGASFEKVIDGVRHFHELRKSMNLARRPKLCISWTLKKNNIREFPEFVRFMAQFEPDRYYVRHLFLFHPKDAQDSLLDVPELANEHLAKAYALMAEQGVETDCPPLFDLAVETFPAPEGEKAHAAPPAAPAPAQDRNCTYIHRSGSILANGEVVTCGVQYVATAGHLDGKVSFGDLWNGEVMRGVRRDINTPREWDQCRNCWIRQSRFHEQREERARGVRYKLDNLTRFSKKAWDFRDREDMTR